MKNLESGRAHANIELTSQSPKDDGDRRITFGRSADVIIDDNPFMHRIAGAFVSMHGVWMLQNEGAATSLSLVDDTGRRVNLPPGARAALTSGHGSVRWRSGHDDYRVDFVVESPPESPPNGAAAPGPATATLVPPLTGREIDFMVTMARHLLVGSARPVPTYAEVAHVWKVSTKTVDNTIQNLKAKLAAAGMPAPATTDELVALLVDTGAIDHRDLQHAALDRDDGPVRAVSKTGHRS